uniref:Uncharacterized protein n=1 Tax=Solanum lycopersicum TaxID=4081 RepID=A0A494GAC6_SOLLC
MPSSPLGSTYGRTTSEVACYYLLWEALTVERRRAWHANITFEQHTPSNDVGRGMPASPLGSTHTHTVEQRRAWHAITTLGHHTRSDDFGRGMLSSPLGSTNSRTPSGVACHHRPWIAHKDDVGHGMRSPLLDCTHCRAWHDITAIGQHTIGRRRAWNNITALGQRTRLDYVRHGMTSLPLCSITGRTTSSVACHYRLYAAHTIE